MAEIRRATEQDAEVIAGLLTELGYPSDRDQALRSLQQALADPAQQVLVTERDGKVVALAALVLLPYFHVGERIARLASLVVSESLRGHQIGANLLKAAEQWALAQGCRQLELTSSTRRERAHAFYVRAGYQPSAWRFVKQLAD